MRTWERTVSFQCLFPLPWLDKEMLDKEEFRSVYEVELPKYERANEHLKQLLNNLLDDLSGEYQVRAGFVTGSPKSLDALFDKACREKYAFETPQECFAQIGDIARARVVCYTIEDCYRILDLLQKQDMIYVDLATIDDKILTPTETGYRAIHLQVGVNIQVSGITMAVPCELQVRSTLQEAWGFFTHEDVYKGGESPPLVRELMRELSDLLNYADRQAVILRREIVRVAQGSLESDIQVPNPQHDPEIDRNWAIIQETLGIPEERIDIARLTFERLQPFLPPNWTYRFESGWVAIDDESGAERLAVGADTDPINLHVSNRGRPDPDPFPELNGEARGEGWWWRISDAESIPTDLAPVVQFAQGS